MSLQEGLRATLIGGVAPLFIEARHYHTQQSKAANGDMSRSVKIVQSILVQRDTSRLARNISEGATERSARFIILQSYEGRAVTPPVDGDTFRVIEDGLLWVISSLVEDAVHSHWIAEVARVG